MISPIAGATSVQSLQVSIAPTNNAAELVKAGSDSASDRNTGTAVNTPVINNRVDGERGNLVSLIA